jgi:hypothetical protein
VRACVWGSLLCCQPNLQLHYGGINCASVLGKQHFMGVLVVAAYLPALYQLC